MKDLALYVLVNEDIKIGKGKLAGQVGHAVSTWLYRHYIRNYQGDRVRLSEDMVQTLDAYMEIQRKIVLKCPQSTLEVLEQQGFITIRDKGFTQLEPNTLTCVCYGLLDRDAEEIPEWLQALKLYH